MSVVNNTLLLAAEEEGGYRISRSVRLRSSASAFLSRTPASASDRRTWTFSFWMKRGSLGVESEILNCYNASLNRTAYLRWNTDNTLTYFDYDAGGGTFINRITTTQVFRDPSAWYHIVLTYDTSNATSSERLRFYVNGQRVTTLSIASYPSLNYEGVINTTSAVVIGKYAPGSSGYFDGYITEVNFINAQALTPSSFGEYNEDTGVWQPIEYAGTYGTNGFYLNFSDNSAATAAAIGADSSGNGNNWTPNNISVTAGVTYDSMIDVPTPYADRGNYAVWNPLSSNVYNPATDGNLRMDVVNVRSCLANIAMSSGKWYCEMSMANVPSIVGVAPATLSYTTAGGDAVFSAGGGWGYVSTGSKRSSGTDTSYGASWTSGDIIGIAYDADDGSIVFYKNGTSQGTAFTGISVPVVFAAHGGGGTSIGTFAYLNAGQRPFAYTPPTGFKALQTGNLPESTITQGSQYFDASVWAGDNTSSRIITNTAGFAPDFVWTKTRNVANSHLLYDKLRGPSTSGASKALSSNSGFSEGSINDGSTFGYLSSFESNGFGVTKGSSDQYVNRSGNTYVAWSWKANGAGVTNTAGSITSTVSANTTSGLSVVTYTGTGSAATVGHGLGVAPSMVIAKPRSQGDDWAVYFATLGVSQYLILNSTATATTSTNFWNPISASSFGVSAGGLNNRPGATTVAYCFAPVAGYSAFGSYTGNGSSDGTFVFCGFRPKYVLIKRTNASNDWYIHDTSMSPFNVAKDNLLANSADSQGTSFNWLDIVSNGFKCRTSDGGTNASGGTYIYVAFAENPFKNALAR